MSALAGVLWLDGRDATAEDAGALLRHLAYRSPEGINVAVNGPASIGVAYRARVPEDIGVVQPLRSTDGTLSIAFDGFLDNREELRAALGTEPGAPDGQFALDAYARWGLDAPRHLLGDFAFVVWDQPQRRWFAARDIAGVRPFFYRRSATRLAWASDMQALVRDEPPAINEGFVAEVLADALTSPTDTLYAGVFRLAPAHSMTVSGQLPPRVWRYWSPDPAYSVRYRHDAEYDEHFRALLDAAVRARLRAVGPPGLLFSGGVDSSAIAVAAAAARDRGDAAAACLRTYSMRIPGATADESRYFIAGARALRLPNVVRDMYLARPADLLHDAHRSLDTPEDANSLGIRDLRDAMAGDGVRIQITGHGGDTWLAGSQFGFIDDVWRLRWGAALGRLWDDRHLSAVFSAANLAALAIWVPLPLSIKRLARRALGRSRVPPWIRAELAARVSLEDRLRQPSWAPDFPTFAARDVFLSSATADSAAGTDQQERIEARYGLTQRHPFYDRRLIEFALAVPNDQLWLHGAPRRLTRRALAPETPPILRERIVGPDFSFIALDAWERAGGRPVIDGIAAQLHDWIHPEAIGRLIDLIAAGRGQPGRSVGRYLWPVKQIVGVHYWLLALRGLRS